VLLVYSVADRSSFDALQSWVDAVKPLLGEGVPLVLLGSKTDLASTTDPAEIVTADEAQTLAESVGATAWEASALRQTGAVEVVFSEILRLALRWKLQGQGEEAGPSVNGGLDAVNVADMRDRLELLEAAAAAAEAKPKGSSEAVGHILGHTIQAEDGALLWLCPACGWGQEHGKRDAEPVCDRCSTAEHEESLKFAAAAEAEAAPAKPKGVVGALLAGLGQGCMERQCKPEI